MGRLSHGRRWLSLIAAAAALITLTAAAPAARAATSTLTATTTLEASSFEPVPSSSARLVDTRYGISSPTAPIPPHGTLTVNMTFTVVPDDASSVVLNVVATKPTQPGFLTVYAGARPATSSLDFTAAQTVGNLVTVTRGTPGSSLSFYNGSAGSVHVVVDVLGYNEKDNAGSTYHPSDPARVLDTRAGTGTTAGPVAAGGSTTLTLPANKVPNGATAVLLNVTPIAPGAYGHVSIVGDANGPSAWINFARGHTVPQLVLVALTSARSITVGNGSSAPLQVAADLAGYFLHNTTASAYYPAVPTRWLDTRTGAGGTDGPLAPHESRTVNVIGAGIPGDATGAVVNVTVTGSTAGGYLTALPNQAQPTTSNLNYGAGQTVANLVVVRIGRPSEGHEDSAHLVFYNGGAASVQVVVDLVGYYKGGFLDAVASPVVGADDQDFDLQAVDCADLAHCIAVGDYRDPHEAAGGLIVEGGAFGPWEAQDAAIPEDASINPAVHFIGVTCVSSTWCAALRTYTAANGHKHSVVDVFSNNNWTAAQLPLPAGASDLEPAQLSCGAQGSCAVVGWYVGTGGVAHGLLERLASGTWSAVTAPLPAGADSTKPVIVNAVSCPASGRCFAVGRYTGTDGVNHGLIESLSAGSWTATTAPAPAGTTGDAQELLSISCASTSFCAAPGGVYDIENDNAETPIAAMLSAGVWTAVAVGGSLTTFGGQAADSMTTTCPAVGSCMAVSFIDGGAQGKPFSYAERLQDGTWSTSGVPAPIDTIPFPSEAFAVVDSRSALSCFTLDSCGVAGSYDPVYGGTAGLVDTWRNSRWTSSRVVTPTDVAAYLPSSVRSVSCPTADTCVAVGNYGAANGHTHGLIETWR